MKNSSADPWHHLRQYTQARIALGRSGTSLPTSEVLAFEMAHAQAKDAVLQNMDFRELQGLLDGAQVPWIELHSQARSRSEYLKRPDLGRRLSVESLKLLQAHQGDFDLAVVLADGLSAQATQSHGWAVLRLLLRYAQHFGWKVAPVVLAHQARVALADEVGQTLRAKVAVVLLGERPGLSTPDSLGIYLTYHPKVGTPDSGRNCISNIHSKGLGYQDAAHTLHFLLGQALLRQLSGVALKDESQHWPRLALPGL